MERRDLRVGTGIREVDRVPDAVLAERLAGVELPAEERVDGERHLAEMLLLRVADEVGLRRVAVVERRLGVVEDVVRLRAEADAAHEAIEAVHRGLEMHDRLAALVVRLVDRRGVVDLGDARASRRRRRAS